MASTKHSSKRFTDNTYYQKMLEKDRKKRGEKKPVVFKRVEFANRKQK